MADKPQFKMYLDQELIDALDGASTEYDRRSGQQVAEEIIKKYFHFWVQAQIVEKHKRERQYSEEFNIGHIRGNPVEMSLNKLKERKLSRKTARKK